VPDTGRAVPGNPMKNNTPYVSGDTYISNEEALRIYHMMEYTFDKGEFIKGMNVELEHQDVTDGSLVKTAMIAAAHLREVPNYYTLLLKYVEPKHEQLVGPDGTINGGPTPSRVNKMKKSQLQELIQEVLDEMQSNVYLSAGRVRDDQADRADAAGDTKLAKNLRKAANKLFTHTDTKRAEEERAAMNLSPASKRKFGVKNEVTPMKKIKKNLAVQRHGKDVVKKAGTRLPTSYESPGGMGPTWDQQHTTIGRSSAKSGGLDNPNAAANRKKIFGDKLKEYIREVLDEVINEGQLGELSPKKLSQYVKDAADSLNYSAHSAGFDSGERFAKGRGQNLNDKNYKKANKRLKGIATATDKLTKESRLGEEYYDRLSHSGRKAAQRDLEYRSAEHLRKLAAQKKSAEPTKPKTPTPSVKENTMPTLQEILMEGKESRVLLAKLTVLMEKLQPDFTNAQATKMMELCSETHQMVNLLNATPYTIHNHMDWKILKMGLVQKLMEVKVEAEKINSEKLNTTSFIKALDELIVQ